jgi:hypothetical protein
MVYNLCNVSLVELSLGIHNYISLSYINFFKLIKKSYFNIHIYKRKKPL